MYSKKTHIKVNIKSMPNDFIEDDDKLINTFSTRNNIKKSNIKVLYTEENKNIDNSLNNDYFKEYYYAKKNKKNFVSYYSKKKYKSYFLNNDKNQLSNYIMRPEPFYSDLKGLEAIKKNVTYTIRNPQKEKSKNKNNKNIENNNIKNTINKDNKDEYEEDVNNLNLNNNNNTLYTDFLNNSAINKKTNINRSFNDSRRGNIDLSRYQEKNFSSRKKHKNSKHDFLQQSGSNISRGISFIMDYSKDDDRYDRYDRYNIGNESPMINKITLNSSINRNVRSPLCSSRYDESIKVKRKKNKTPNRNSDKIKKQIKDRKKNFKKMREIEKEIKKYFKENGIKLKNRELYHQSAIMIQSTFRAYLSRKDLYKELNKFVGIRTIFDLLNKYFSEKNINYYKIFFNNIKQYYNKKQNEIIFIRKEEYQKHIKNKSVILNKSNIIKSNIIKKNFIIPKVNNYNNLLKIDSNQYFNIINKNNSKQNILLLKNENEKLLNEKKQLEKELIKLKLENEKLQKDNETYKSKESQLSQLSNTNSLTLNKIISTNIHKNDENIENVSLELKEIKKKKKKIDALNIPILNLKKNTNILDKFWQDQNNYKKYKNLYLKYLILKKNVIFKEYFRKIFYKYFNNIKNNIKEKKEKNDLDKNNKINKFKNILEIIYIKYKTNLNILFFEKFYKFLFLKEIAQKSKIYVHKSKMIKPKINNNEIINKEKKQKLKRLIKDKINKQNNFIHNKFIKFYYLGLINNNNNNNNFIINKNNFNKKEKSIEIITINKNERNIGQIKALHTVINNYIKKNKIQLKIEFYKFYFKGIIFSFKNIHNNNNINNINNIHCSNQKNENNNNIYIKKIYENNKNYKNNE